MNQEIEKMTSVGASVLRVGLAVLATLVLGAVAFTGEAAARSAGPVLDVTQQALPSTLTAGQSGSYSIAVENMGSKPTSGAVTVTDVLPAGVTFTRVDTSFGGAIWSCPAAPGDSTVTCTLQYGEVHVGTPDIPAHASTPPPLQIFFNVDPGTSGRLVNTVTVSGGGSDGNDVSTIETAISATASVFGVAGFSGWASNLDGSAAHQAGAHPDLTTTINFASEGKGASGPVAVGNVKDIVVDLPPGVLGNPTATPTCKPSDLADVVRGAQCAAETQIGTADIFTAIGSPTIGVQTPSETPIFNIDAPAGSPGRFGMNIVGVVVTLDPIVRTGGGYSIAAKLSGVSQTLALVSSKVTLWGVPADPVHDWVRGHPTPYGPVLGTPSASKPRPFLTAPTSCTGAPLRTSMTATSWQDPDRVSSASFDSDFDGDAITTTGCDGLAFDPSFEVRADSAPRRGAPAGLGIDLTIPQNDNPDGLATAQLKKAVVTLPEGMAVNPSSAQGLEACSPTQIDLDGPSAPSCPVGSKIGSVEVKTPVLKDPLEGSIYLASQKQNPFGTTLAMYIVVEGAGVVIKLPGRIDPDPATGRLTATFDDNPQLPFEKLSLHLKTGPRAPISLPTTCGPATTTAVLTPWSGTAPVTLNTSFTVSQDGNGAPCPPLGFAPTFVAGTDNAAAGKDSAFALGFSRTDDDQQLSGVNVTMPKGLLARISSTTQCDDAQAGAGTCGDGSKIGEVTTAAGAGSNPFSLPGRVYLTGPYKGGPFGLSIVVPAVAGPFNLGTVVVRAAITIDPITAQVTVVSDPLPTILEGIPLQVRLVKVDVNRPGFTINPTSCAPKSVDGQLKSTAGATATVSARFQVGNCANLVLKPSLALSLSGKGQTTDGKHPAITANLTQPKGQANLKKVRVALPLSLALDPDNANGLCEFADGSKAEPTCPKASIVGTATATTPILDEPLTGPVYFVKNIRKDPKSGRDIRTLPKLVIPLVGENGVKLTLTGTSDVEDDQLVTTFDNIPDAPVSSFKLSIIGGKGGILTVSGTDICKSTQIVDQQIDGQNGKVADADVFIQTRSCPLKVLSKKVGKTSVAVKVSGLGAGKVTVSGRGIKKTSKTIAGSTVATITAKRTKGTPGKLTVSFDPAGRAKARKITK